MNDTNAGGSSTSNRNQPLVLVTEGSDPQPLAWLAQRVRVVEAPAESAEFASLIGEAQGLVVRTYTRVNTALLDRAPRLKVVGRGGVGLENIDVPACRKRGVEVVYTPDANTISVAEFVIGYMLQILRPWNFFSERAYSSAEFKHIRNTVRGRQLDQLTLGILGMGRVGRALGRRASVGLNMRVIYHDIRRVEDEVDFPATRVSPDELYAQADVLSIHVDMRPGNENLVGAPQLAMMKPTSIVINTSRGEVLDAVALAAALRQERLYGAALDVYAPEPPPADFPLLGLPRVLLTPHLAARTETALGNMSWVTRDVEGVLRGEKPMFPAP